MAKKAKGKTDRKKKKAKPPINRALPGMEQARHTVLDSVCEALSAIAKRAAKAAADRNDEISRARSYMPKENVQVYKHHGIELAMFQGEVTIKAKTVKEPGTAKDDGEE